MGHQVINSVELQTCNDGEEEQKKLPMEAGVCGRPAGKAGGPHGKVGPGVGRVARHNQVSYLLIVADRFTFGRTYLEKGVIKNCL